MAQIILEVEEKKLPTLMTILQNLKEGLVQDIEVCKQKSANKKCSIQKRA